MYWAWKNVEADYYGLCHYRRYLSFSDKKYKINKVAKSGISTNCIVCDFINDNTILQHNLTEKYMLQEITKYDIIKMDAIDLYKTFGIKNNKKQIELAKDWHKDKDFEHVREIIKNRHSQYLPYYDKYMNSRYGYFYMLFIMNKKFFYMYCEWLFDILFELEKVLNDTTYRNIKQLRLYGTVAERLYGIFLLYLTDNFDIKIGTKQVLFIEHPEKQEEITPFSINNNIPIIMRISDYYAPYFAVLLQSIIDNANSSNSYDIIVMEKSVSKENKQIIANMIRNINNISIRYINPEYYLENLPLHVSSTVYAREAYYTLFAPYLLQKYDKILVIDSDLILTNDIAEIYNQDITNYFAGACKDIVYMGMVNADIDDYTNYATKILQLKNPYNYVNTGVILLNTKKIREEFTFNNMLEQSKNTKYRIQEQDLINVLFDGRINFIDNKYNYYVTLNNWIGNNIQNAPISYNRIYQEIREKATIIHWASHPKPWVDPTIELANKWWEIARKTPFYETILARMSEAQASNVSNDYYSKMFPMKWRKKIHKIGYVRQIADKLLPLGSKRRKIVKKLLLK